MIVERVSKRNFVTTGALYHFLIAKMSYHTEGTSTALSDSIHQKKSMAYGTAPAMCSGMPQHSQIWERAHLEVSSGISSANVPMCE